MFVIYDSTDMLAFFTHTLLRKVLPIEDFFHFPSHVTLLPYLLPKKTFDEVQYERKKSIISFRTQYWLFLDLL